MKEILTNIISYGYRDNREHEVKVRLSVQLGEVSVEIEDDGQPFNPLEAPEPDVTNRRKKRRSVDSEFILCANSWTDLGTSAPRREKSTDY